MIGASRNPHKLGFGVLRNLVDYGYRGGIYPVNRSATEILGKRCYSTVTDVPDPVDLAVVVVPAKAVAATLEECGERGIGHAVIVSGGFGETGEEGRQREEQVKRVVDAYGMQVIGPNCIGTIDTHTPVNTTFVTGMPEAGEIGFSSQSGAMVAAVIDWALGAGVGFSRIASLGNQVDVNETQMIEAIRKDPQTAVITAYIEGVSDGRSFMDMAQQTSREKPFVVLKGGHGERGSEAVASHTGALAGSFEAYKAAFERSGVLRADTMEEMFDWARALAWQPLPEGRNVAVLTNAGGPAILAVDALEEAGLRIASLSESTRSYLRERLPAAASINNPVDVLAGSGPGSYAVALDALLTDPTVDAVLVIQAPQDWFLPASLAEVVGDVATSHNKPVIASIMGKASVDDALSILHKRKIPNVTFPERAASVLAAMVKRREWLTRKVDSAATFTDIDREVADAAVAAEAWGDLVEAYGIPLPSQQVASTLEEAVEIAGEIGYPVALKIWDDEVVHKTEVGGVRLNIRNEKELKENYRAVVDALELPAGVEKKVLVQRMLEGGYEVIVGIRQDAQFGPLILFGSGGVDVELLRDVETGIAPLNRYRAEELIDATRAGVKLRGWRNQPEADRETVIEYLQRMAQLAVDYPSITELEINPLYVLPKGEGAFAVDIRGSAAETKAERKTADLEG